MAQPDKYYYINSKSNYGRFKAFLAKWNERFYVDLVENYDWIQYIDLYLFKFKDKHEKPKTDTLQKVRPVLKELFEDYYNGALSYIANKDIEDWEYYIIPENEKCFKVEAFATNESNDKGCIQFNFLDDIEDFSFSVYSSTELKGRPSARKNGTPITFELFKQFYNISFQYLSDHESIFIYYEQFIKNFKNLASGKDEKVKLFNVSTEKSFKDIITQLKKRKAAIEKRLIENDQDSKEKRLQLRGELEGIIYALKTINIFK